MSGIARALPASTKRKAAATALRQGFGGTLADGSKHLREKLGHPEACLGEESLEFQAYDTPTTQGEGLARANSDQEARSPHGEDLLEEIARATGSAEGTKAPRQLLRLLLRRLGAIVGALALIGSLIGFPAQEIYSLNRQVGVLQQQVEDLKDQVRVVQGQVDSLKVSNADLTIKLREVEILDRMRAKEVERLEDRINSILSSGGQNDAGRCLGQVGH